MSENETKAKIKSHIGRRDDTLLLPNPTGLGVVGEIERFQRGATKTTVYNPRYMSFGLGSKPGTQNSGGFPDYVGCRSVLITTQMVGSEVGIFFGLEIKRPGRLAEPLQVQRIALLKSFGALAGVAHSVDEAVEIMAYDRF